MSRIMFVSADAGGNLPPALALARTLAAHGHEVAIAGSPRQSTRVGDVAFRSLPALADWPDPTAPCSAVATVRKYLRLAASRRIAADAAAAARDWAADAVVVDCMMPSSAQAVHESGKRTAILFHTLLSYWTGPWAHGPIGGLARLAGTDAVRAWSQADARLVTTVRELDSGSLPETSWIGTTESGVAAMPAEPPLVLVSFSSIFYPGQAAAYRNVIAALGTLPVRAIVTIGAGESIGGETPPNVEVRGYADHSQLMPGAALVITHGGHSTTLKALAHGIPVLVVPMYFPVDHPIIGRSVEQAAVGAVVSHKARPAEFAAAIAGLLGDPARAVAARALGERIRATDAAESAARIIAGLAPSSNAVESR
ncbi:glycosyltransferase [Gryllotalpicola protaetiae]|uniref:Glycosyltransferase n=1 Tax=Gryllotalpicola protaetiae TaxID=2419771 RepID=A0A387BQW0_9MICO|nr:nucleotide disphospho-sugar-binding domain-containing protein [Gryllotalpicola protaetiae]AYG04464.1 glycosyltransferase [Gryllotalpicola protaetiae]